MKSGHKAVAISVTLVITCAWLEAHMYPSRKDTFRIEGLDPLACLQERLLRNVFGAFTQDTLANEE